MKIVDKSILFFSRISLSKFSVEALYNTWVEGVFILVCVWNAKGQVCNKQSGLVAWPRDLTNLRVNYLARLEVLSYTAPAGMTLQLPCMLHTCASFSDLPTASQS